MPDSQREKVFKALKAKALEVEGVKAVYRGKVNLTQMEYPAIQIVPGGDFVEESIGTLITRTMQVFVVAYVAAQSEILAAVEAFLPKVQKKMLADQTRGGLTIDVDETAVPDVSPANAEETVANAIIEYQVMYRVSRTNPYGVN